MNTTHQAVEAADSRCFAADGVTPTFTAPGLPIMVAATAFNKLYSQRAITHDVAAEVGIPESELLDLLMRDPELCQLGTYQRAAVPGESASGITIAVDPMVLKIVRAVEARAASRSPAQAGVRTERFRHIDVSKPSAGVAGGVDASPLPTGFVARHADRSKTDTTASMAGDASRGQDSFHVANAETRGVQASDSRAYTDAQLAAGVEALGICRGMGIPLSDETVAGIVYDYMTAAGPKRPLTIYMDEDPIDVEQFYRAKGFEKLPATPTMTGQEIRDCGWKKQHDRQMFIDHGNTGKQFQPIGTTEAVILVDGMRFVSIPAATWEGGRQ